jgi:hypothetical protein
MLGVIVALKTDPERVNPGLLHFTGKSNQLSSIVKTG